MRGRRFRFTTLETSVSHATDIFMLKRIAWTFLDNWNFEKRRDSEDRHHLLESRHLDLRRRTIDFGAFNGLFGSAYAQEKAGTVNSPIEIRDNKDTRQSPVAFQWEFAVADILISQVIPGMAVI